ncbi:hypothetical protein HYW67_01725 [Candidatus Parcubacteria bacterium]|nr:hypothetical protein [Candidatus Parcubacteria bacterium]
MQMWISASALPDVLWYNNIAQLRQAVVVEGSFEQECGDNSLSKINSELKL